MSEPSRPRASRPQRVRVTSPRMAPAARPARPPVTREIDEQTGVGEVYMRSLVRSQLRHALAVLSVVVLVLATLPAVFALLPGLAEIRLLTVPLPWLVIGVAVYPLLLGGAWWYVRMAERTEDEFAALVERRER